MKTITKQEYETLKAKYDHYHSERNRIFPEVNCFTPEMQKQLPESPTHSEISSIEVYEFCNDIPSKYFLYIDEQKRIATTWTGEKLGTVSFGRKFRSNFGDSRIPVSIYAINGKKYNGTYYCSAGSYARVRIAQIME